MQYDTAAAATTRSMDGNDVSCVVCVARMPGERPTVLSLEVLKARVEKDVLGKQN